MTLNHQMCHIFILTINTSQISYWCKTERKFNKGINDRCRSILTLLYDLQWLWTGRKSCMESELCLTSTCGTETVTELPWPISTIDFWVVSTEAGLKSSTMWERGQSVKAIQSMSSWWSYPHCRYTIFNQYRVHLSMLHSSYISSFVH